MRRFEGQFFRDNKLAYYNPIEGFSIGDNALPTETPLYETIARIDWETGILPGEFAMFDLGNWDSGTILELGIYLGFIELGRSDPTNIVVVIPDERYWVEEKFKPGESPVGINQFILGSLKRKNIAIFGTSRGALLYLKRRMTHETNVL